MKLNALFLMLLYIGMVRAKPECIFVITSYNNSSWCQLNLDTLVEQDYTNWTAYYIDDCSSDDTGEKVKNYIKTNRLEHKIIYIRNEQRKYKIYNLFAVIDKCPDQAIICIYDGDDWLAHNRALSRIVKEYENPNTWVTYGSYQDKPGEQYAIPLPPHAITHHLFRKNPFVFYTVPGHPFTFYAWLFKKIKHNDFVINGIPFPSAGSDMIFIPPILEMAAHHFVYIPDILYIHNCLTPIADCKVSNKTQSGVSTACMKKTPYKPL